MSVFIIKNNVLTLYGESNSGPEHTPGFITVNELLKLKSEMKMKLTKTKQKTTGAAHSSLINKSSFNENHVFFFRPV